MRTLMMMALGAGLAAAQDPPKPPADPPKAEEKTPDEKKLTPEQQKKMAESLDRALRRSWETGPATVQGTPSKQPCAIPLLNVLKPAPGATVVRPDPMIVVPGGPARPGKGEEAQVPAPSCDDLKKK